MAGMSINRWSKKWDSLSGSDFEKASELLFEYCQSYKKTPVFSFSHVWGSKIGLFFSGRWGTNHGQAVQRTLGSFHDMDALGREYQTVRNLLNELKRNLSGQLLKKDGDLNRILNVIQQKTNINFEAFSEEVNIEIYNNYGEMENK
ncbi:hypothetical protein DIZ81_03600 [Legionella taurinensis]|uniref:DUF5617 domain-containing protein n=1 Tax=Legionella taurinensis TaxID=70611 RepID=A0A3A5L0M2_9GAMM|nr:hypothetical protein [Legionella taurinensis]MDX1836749.1 hypothetical protein [Legionella taurinensis]PUT41172.1 hypothetical protein DB744_03600 [Legionella taurinensis]PUT42297.1 hypothetical protein DB746_07530 [Legionella taurinensis]PUT43822.1 hypothetical protein DB743_09480 [Legionella taurinensis]PUT47078.1 hypothetical protein DB745_08610 [Legionella taurinensis]